MDDSGREHSYDYDIDEGDDDDDGEPHDDFEDVPDDDDEDDDMDEDDDDEEEDVVLVDPMVAPMDASNQLSASLTSALNELRSMRTRVDIPMFPGSMPGDPIRGSHHHLAQHAIHFLESDQLVTTIPSRSVLNAVNAAAAAAAAREPLRSVVLDRFESRRRIPLHEGLHRGVDSLATLTACLRGGLSALQPSRYWSNDSDIMGNTSAIHPMLCRPPLASSQQETSDPASDAFAFVASMRRSVAASRGSRYSQPLVSSGPPPPRSGESSGNPRLRIAQSFQNIRQALNAVVNASTPAPAALPTFSQPSNDPASNPGAEGMPSASAGPSPAGPSLRPPLSLPSAVDVAAAASLASLRAGSAAGPSSATPIPPGPGPPPTIDDPERQAGEISAWLDAALNAGTEYRSRLSRLAELADQDLMRSVEPMGRSTMENVLGMLSWNRNPYERLVNRDREREKIPSGILKRWVYDPPSCGGDSLPPMFDADAGQRNSRGSGRSSLHNSGQPLIAPESHEAVNQLHVKITHRLDVLLKELAKIDKKVTDQEQKEKKKKEDEEKKKEADKEKSEPKQTKENEAASIALGADGSSAVTGPDKQETAMRQPAENAQRSDTLLAPGEQGSASGSAAPEEVERQPVSNSEPAAPDASNPDSIMSAADDEPRRQEEAPESPVSAENDAAVREGEGNAGEGANEDVDAIAPTPNDFAAVSAQRAAAAGISLDAPANENPEVVAAATESTGIDPAFLAALPEEMRSEILTQYYEQIRTNAAGGPGSSSSPSATTVNQDFLRALPPVLRAEVLELEAEFQSRHNDTSGGNTGIASGTGGNQEVGGSGAAMAGAAMDNATFFATLGPELREELLLTSEEAIIESLPPNVAAEARVLRDRESVSRFPWRMGGDFPIGLQARRYPNGMRGPSQMHRRQPSRHQPREAPSYRWKKVENGWLREVPKASDEPRPALKSDGLSSLINLLWVKQGQYGKSLIYQVLCHACKSTESRLRVLEELIKLITGDVPKRVSFASGSTLKRSEVERARHHGTVVRRALELLTLLCKNDAVVAETLLGLPQTNEDLALVPEIISEDTIIPHREADVSLSTLVSLLDSPLFVRSTSHLEQLLGLINALCVELPATLLDESDRRNGRRSLIRRRRFNGRSSGLGHELHDSMNILLVDPDVDGGGDPHVFHHVDGDDDDDEDSDEDPYENTVIPRPEREPEARRGATEAPRDVVKADTEEDIPIPPQYRIPGFRKKDLVSLTRVLLRQGCSDRTYEKVSRSIGVLGELVPIRITFVDSLVTIAVNSGQEMHKEYEKVISAIAESQCSSSSGTKSDVISSFSVANAASELTLLRVVKSLSALWEHEAEENCADEEGDDSDGKSKEKSSGEERKDSPVPDSAAKDSVSSIEAGRKQVTSTERRFRPSMLSGLQGLWRSLDRLLKLVADEDGVKSKKQASENVRNARSSSEVLVDHMKSANRSLSPVLARLSPMIEAFLVTHSGDQSRDPSDSKYPESPRTPSSPMPGSSTSSLFDVEKGVSADGQLAVFVERHRGPINALLRANPPLLETSFKGALRHPHAIDFDNKKAYFRNVLRRRSSEAHAGTIRINVRRDRVFDDSYQQLRLRTPDEMKGRLHVQFTGEEGVDAGGVTREWYIILARQIFDPNYVLFTRSAAKAATYQPDKRSYINKAEYLDNFKFVGRIIGKAIYDEQLLDAYFTRSFYKHILGLKPTYHDIEAQDPEYFKSLKWMLENDITGILDYTMSAEYDEFGEQTVIDLMPNGRNIPVTEENKAEYVRLVTEVRMTKTIEKQIEAFKEGFHELIPHEDCKIFNELELELLMSGLPDIDMADLKANVEYTGYTASSPQVNWFWRCVGKMDQEDLARLVMFVTGTSKVPLEGFSNLQGMNGTQKFQIHRVAGNTLRLPSAHTCFNQLDLPEYSSAEILSERLLRAVRECSVGFGFA